MYVYIYIYIYTYTHVYIYIYIYIYNLRLGLMNTPVICFFLKTALLFSRPTNSQLPVLTNEVATAEVPRFPIVNFGQLYNIYIYIYIC